MSEQITTETNNTEVTEQEKELFKIHLDNLYLLFDPQHTLTDEQLIICVRQPIQALFVLLSFIVNTKDLVELPGLNDEFVKGVFKAFDQQSEDLLKKMEELSNKIKLCVFSKLPLKECPLFYELWSEILETFLKSLPSQDQTLTQERSDEKQEDKQELVDTQKDD